MNFDDLIANLGRQDTIAHIGPSVLYESFRLYQRTAAQIVVAEPDPTRAAMIYRAAKTSDKVQILECAVLPQGRRADLRRYNFDALNNLCEADVLNALFPGLHETDRSTVNVLPVSAFVKKLHQQHRGRDLLVLDSLGEELGILTALAAEGALERFQNIILRIVRHDDSENSSPTKNLFDWLANNQYDRWVVLDGADPNIPVLYFQRNPLGKDYNQQKDLAASFRAENEARGKALVEAQQTMKKSEDDLRVALRLQSAAQDDLKDLQQQYAQLRADKHDQDELLRKVTQKLSYASDYLRRIAIDTPDAAGLVERTPLEADEETSGETTASTRQQLETDDEQ